MCRYEQIAERIGKFTLERDWEQYHDPKNLSMSIAIEAAELMELFQWLTSAQSEPGEFDAKKTEAIRDETADIVIYAIRMSQMVGFNLLEAIDSKISKNEKKYPADKVRGKYRLE